MRVIKIRKAKLHKIKKQALTKPAFHLPKKKKYTTSNDYYFYISNTDPGQFPVLMRALVVILKTVSKLSLLQAQKNTHQWVFLLFNI